MCVCVCVCACVCVWNPGEGLCKAHSVLGTSMYSCIHMYRQEYVFRLTYVLFSAWQEYVFVLTYVQARVCIRAYICTGKSMYSCTHHTFQCWARECIRACECASAWQIFLIMPQTRTQAQTQIHSSEISVLGFLSQLISDSDSDSDSDSNSLLNFLDDLIFIPCDLRLRLRLCLRFDPSLDIQAM